MSHPIESMVGTVSRRDVITLTEALQGLMLRHLHGATQTDSPGSMATGGQFPRRGHNILPRTYITPVQTLEEALRGIVIAHWGVP